GRRGVTLASLRRDEDEHAVMLDTLGALYALGVPVCWQEGGPARVPPPGPAPRGVPLPVPLSARSEAALRAQAEALIAHLERRPACLTEIARSLATTRTHFEHRAVVVARERAELHAGLEAIAQGAS